jgi:DNA polymerase-3 subunit beta
MKVTVERSDFLKALSHTQNVVEKRNTVPILSHVLLTAQNDQLHLMATDLDLAISEVIGAHVEEEGSTTVPASTLYEIVRKLSGDEDVSLNFHQDSQILYVTSGRSEFKLSCLLPKDFPKVTPGDLPFSFSITSENLKKLLDNTHFAMSTEEARYYLNGVYLHETQSNGQPVLRAVASDAHRLALAEITSPDGSKGMPGIILGRKVVQEIRHLLDGSPTLLTLSLSETQIKLTLPGIQLSSRLIDGAFPNYETVIPAHNGRTLVVKTKTFSDSVSRVSTILTEKHKAIKLKINNNVLLMSAINPDCGNAVDSLEVNSDVPGLEIGFNARYLTDITHQISGDDMILRLDDTASPTIFQDQNQEGTLFVLMPMRV